MKQRFSSYRKRLSAIIAVCLLCSAAYCQESLQSIIEKVSNVNGGPKMTYTYTVKLYSAKSGTCIDSISGRLLKNGKRYLDSSKQGISLVSDKYYIHTQPSTKTVTVFDIDYLSKKMGFKDQLQQGFIIPDSTVLKKAILTEKVGAYEIQMVPPGHNYGKITLTIRKGDYRLLAVLLENDELQNGKPVYRKRYYINNIQLDFNEKRLDSKRFIIVSNNKIQLSKEYAGFKIKTING